MSIDKEGLGIAPLKNLRIYAYDPQAIGLKIDGEKVHGYSCDQKYVTTVTSAGTDIHIFLQGTSPWAGKLKSKVGQLVNVDLSYDNDQPEGLKETASENFTGIVTTFQASFGSEVPEVVVCISGSEHNLSVFKTKHSANKRRV